MHTENLIVGLGIAGINLCHQLEKQGKSFIVIDSCPSHSASLIAGGIYNPIAIKRKIKSWKADELFPFWWMLIEKWSNCLKPSFWFMTFQY
jgi:glycine oxidase